MQRVHASCVSVDGRGLLITGSSGSGKSDLALRLIDGGALLIADDQTELSIENGELIARCPAAIKGLIEARYLGPLPAPSIESTAVAAILEPGVAAELERLPEPTHSVYLGIRLPMVRLPYLEASSPAKVRLWLSSLP